MGDDPCAQQWADAGHSAALAWQGVEQISENETEGVA